MILDQLQLLRIYFRLLKIKCNVMYNPFSLHNKKILVTGASSGIGRAIAIECAKMGACVILTARNRERLEDTVSIMESNVEDHQVITSDLSTEDGVISLAESIPCDLDGIVHCAGVTIPKPFQYYTKNDIDIVMFVNFQAPVMLTQALLRNKKIKKKSSIVFISSISGVWISSIASSIYSASKGAINGIAKGLALELAPRQIRVNCVNPGMVDTNIYKDSVITEDLLEEDRKKYPLKRYGKPEEVAYAVIYLLSDASTWVTGTNLLIDGGYTLL